VASGGLIGFGLGNASADTNEGPVAQEGTPSTGPEPSGDVTNPRAAALEPAGPETSKQLTLEALEKTTEIADGVQYNAWTFGDSLPGPVVHVRQGDTIDFTLKNGSAQGHSIDFHSAQTPWDVNYVTILPGDSLSFEWKANFPGVFMYHCGTPFVLHHIGNGMYGAVVGRPGPAA